MRFYVRFFIAGMICASLAVAGCRAEEEVGQTEEGRLVLGQSEVEQVEARGVAPGGRTLVFDGFNGTIALRGTAAGTADLQFIQRARGRDDQAARETLRDIRIEETGSGAEFRYAMRSNSPEWTAVDVRGEVPHGTALRIDLENGSVVLSGIEGSLQVTVGNGNVRIGGAGTGVVVEVGNGTVETGLQRLPADASVRLRTANGNITLTLPGSADAQVEAETNVGSVIVEGLSFTSRRLNPRGAGARFTGQLGTGNARVELQTQNGSILLREGTVEALPPDAVPGVPSGAIEEGLTSPGPDTAAPTQDSLQHIPPSGPDTSVLREDTSAAAEDSL